MLGGARMMRMKMRRIRMMMMKKKMGRMGRRTGILMRMRTSRRPPGPGGGQTSSSLVA